MYTTWQLNVGPSVMVENQCNKPRGVASRTSQHCNSTIRYDTVEILSTTKGCAPAERVQHLHRPGMSVVWLSIRALTGILEAIVGCVSGGPIVCEGYRFIPCL